MKRLLDRSVGVLVVALIVVPLAGAALAAGSDSTTSLLEAAAQEDGEEADAPEGVDEQRRPCRPHGPGPEAEADGSSGRRPGPPFGRAIHAEVILPDGDGFRTLVLDRGRAVEVSETSLTLERPDGERVTVTVTSETEVYGEPEAGNPVSVAATPDGDALRIWAGPRCPDGPRPTGQNPPRPHDSVSSPRGRGEISPESGNVFFD